MAKQSNGGGGATRMTPKNKKVPGLEIPSKETIQKKNLDTLSDRVRYQQDRAMTVENHIKKNGDKVLATTGTVHGNLMTSHIGKDHRKKADANRKELEETGYTFPKYADGTAGVVAKKYYNSAGQEIQRAKPVAPAYLPSSAITTKGGNPLNVMEAGDPMKYGKDQSSYTTLSKHNGIAAKFEKGGIVNKVKSALKPKDEKKASEINPLDYVDDSAYKSMGESPKIKVKGDKVKIKGNGVKFKGKLKEEAPKKIDNSLESIKDPSSIKDFGAGEDTSTSVKTPAKGDAKVAEWQRKRGLKDDGIWGKDTQAAYEREQASKNKKKITSGKSGQVYDTMKTGYKKSTANPNGGPYAKREYNSGTKFQPDGLRALDAMKKEKMGPNAGLAGAYNSSVGQKKSTPATTTSKATGPNKQMAGAFNSSVKNGANTPQAQGKAKIKSAHAQDVSRREQAKKELSGKSFMDYMVEGTANTNQRTKEASQRGKEKAKNSTPLIGRDTTPLGSRRDAYERVEGGVGKDGKYTKPGIKLKAGYEIKDGKVLDRHTGKEPVPHGKVNRYNKSKAELTKQKAKVESDNARIARIKKEQQAKTAKLLASRSK